MHDEPRNSSRRTPAGYLSFARMPPTLAAARNTTSGRSRAKKDATARASMRSSCAWVRTTRLRSRGHAGRGSAPNRRGPSDRRHRFECRASSLKRPPGAYNTRPQLRSHSGRLPQPDSMPQMPSSKVKHTLLWIFVSFASVGLIAAGLLAYGISKAGFWLEAGGQAPQKADASSSSAETTVSDRSRRRRCITTATLPSSC